ncbi:MAG: hypothetical protein HC854_17025 [Flavobacterium sp.]|nr:hypothetical protein [Flavobacterium sp.]
MQEILAKAETYFKDLLPFVLYINPNSNQLNAYFQLDATLELFKGQSGFVFAPLIVVKNTVFLIKIVFFVPMKLILQKI